MNTRNGLKPGGLIKGGAYLCAGLLYKIVAMILFEENVLAENFRIYQFNAFADPSVRGHVFFYGSWGCALRLCEIHESWDIVCRWKFVSRSTKYFVY